jgi:hypothetical protein
MDTADVNAAGSRPGRVTDSAIANSQLQDAAKGVR